MAGSPRFIQTAPTGGVVNLMLRLSPSRRNIMSQHNGGEPNLIKRCAVLAAHWEDAGRAKETALQPNKEI
jgi:hypothetical protein